MIRSTILALTLLALPLLAQHPTLIVPDSLKEERETLQKGDAKAAFESIKKKAEAGNIDACFALGELYLAGTGVEQSIEKAMTWYQKAADGDQAIAKFRLGDAYFSGLPGVEVDQERGEFFLKASAESGHIPAYGFLGRIARARGDAANAQPVREKHFGEAREYFEKGAAGNDLDSLFGLAVLTAGGLGGDKDLEESTTLLFEAASRGQLQAMNEYGIRQKDGVGMEPNAVAALGWFLAAAERGSLEAMTNLGSCYFHGVGVPQNYDQAGRWYARAAKGGFPLAHFLLGQLYENGWGTEANPVFAYFNYSRAAEQGHPTAIEARDTLKEKLTKDQLVQAEDLLREGNSGANSP